MRHAAYANGNDLGPLLAHVAWRMAHVARDSSISRARRSILASPPVVWRPAPRIVSPPPRRVETPFTIDPGPVRRFVDRDGVHWRVYEHLAVLDRRRLTSLIFESSNVVRRVRTFPENWPLVAGGGLHAAGVFLRAAELPGGEEE